MTYTSLGRSGIQVSRIAFGCMSLHEANGDTIALLHKALDSGINYFDTADLYDRGANEELLGQAFADRRDRVVIATKVGNQWRTDGSGWDWNPRKDYILRSVEESLRRLRTDYIDLYQLHGGTIDDPIDETIEAFEQLKQEGKIRAYGLSSIRPNVIGEWVRRSTIATVMMQYSLLDRRPEESCFPLLMEKGIGVLARGTLAQGMLAGKPAKPYLGFSAEQVQTMAEGLARLGPGAALRFVLQQAPVNAAIVGIRTAAQLQEALEVADMPALAKEDPEALMNLLKPLRYAEHRQP